MERIGFVGLGTMGFSMARNIWAAGRRADRLESDGRRAAELIALGAGEAARPASSPRRSDVVVICVSDTPDVEARPLRPGRARRRAPAGQPRHRLLDHLAHGDSRLRRAGLPSGESRWSTRRFRAARRARGWRRSRSSPAVRTRTSPGPCPSSRRSARRSPTWVRRVPGRPPRRSTRSSSAGIYLGVAEGLVLGMRAGLDPARLVEALSGGSAQSWVLANRSANMIEDAYPLGFKLSLHRKDLGIALELAGRSGWTAGRGVGGDLEDELVAGGHGARICPSWPGPSGSRRAASVAREGRIVPVPARGSWRGVPSRACMIRP